MRRSRGAHRLEARRQVIDGLDVSYPRYWFAPKVLRSWYGWFYWQSIRRTARQLIRQRRPDAVVGYWAHPDGQAAERIAREIGAPAAVVIGGSDVLLLTRDPRRRQCVVDVLARADALVTVNRDLKRKILEYGIPDRKVHVWRQGIDGRWFHPGNRQDARNRLGLDPQARMLLWVGRMVPVKGLEILIDACGVLHGRGEEFHLYLVGDGPLRKALAGRVARLRLEAKVTFVGSRRPEHLGDWYRAADATVLSSRSEGLPNVLRESLACGTRFVASDVGGIAEIAGGTSSRLAPPGDARALADALGEALRDTSPTWLVEPNLVSWEQSARELADILRPLVAAGETVPALQMCEQLSPSPREGRGPG